WREHEMELENQRDRLTVPVTNGDALRDFIEVEHAGRRDFHLARGVFVPFAESERRIEDAPVVEGVPSVIPVENVEVLDEVKRLQAGRAFGLGAWVVLAASVVVFIAAGQANWKRDILIMMVPILLFHELGHLLMMRLFHYRNTRMFFIPFFGAAVTGRNF